MTLPAFELVRPATIGEAVAAKKEKEEAVAICGGTELLLAMRMGLLRPARLVDLKGLAELRRLDRVGDTLVIGAACTHDRLARSPELTASAPMLADVESHVGNIRVRVQGTIGGNVAFAEPKSDVISALIALDATANLVSASGTRETAVQDLILGPYWTDIAEDELLVDLRIPIVDGRRAVYDKFQTMERPTVGVAARVDGDGATRVVVSAVTGQPEVFDFADPTDVDATAIAAELDVIADLTGAEDYKRHLAAVMIRRTTARLDGVAA